MKANNGSGNNIERDEWETPQWLFERLNKQYNFTLDCCANEKNTKCKHWNDAFEEEGVFLVDVCWMNPPFSKAKEMFNHFFKVVDKGVAIYRCDNMETSIWQDIIFPNASWILIPNKRIAYEGMEGNGSRFPSALIGFNIESPINVDGVLLNVATWVE